MNKEEIIKNIALRTKGDIYFGVVGAVRTGKSTFIKKVVENLIIPNMEDEYEKKRALDEIPQSSQGKTIMTIEPKFVPSNAAKVKIGGLESNIRLVDCVGYVVPNAKGYEDENGPRMVRTPWYSEEIPFIEAAEIGTEKVIKEHATIGIVVTTDGSIGELSRDDYVDAEARVIKELKEIGKPFIVILNSTHPSLPETIDIANELKHEYNVPVIPISVLNMNQEDIFSILKEALYEFPVISVNVNMPDWIAVLNPTNELKKLYIEKIKESVTDVDKLRDVENITEHFSDCEEISKAYLSSVDASKGEATINLDATPNLYQETLKKIVGIDINNRADLLSIFQEYSESKGEYSEVMNALKMVKATGYGVAFPRLADMKLDNPEIIKQNGRYGIKLKAVAPSIHMIRIDVESTFEPIIGSEIQSKELIDYIMKDYDKDASSIWKSEIFGRSLDVIVQEGIQSKINLMPDNIRFKLQQTLTKVVNKGSNNLIAFVI